MYKHASWRHHLVPRCKARWLAWPDTPRSSKVTTCARPRSAGQRTGPAQPAGGLAGWRPGRLPWTAAAPLCGLPQPVQPLPPARPARPAGLGRPGPRSGPAASRPRSAEGLPVQPGGHVRPTCSVWHARCSSCCRSAPFPAAPPATQPSSDRMSGGVSSSLLRRASVLSSPLQGFVAVPRAGPLHVQQAERGACATTAARREQQETRLLTGRAGAR